MTGFNAQSLGHVVGMGDVVVLSSSPLAADFEAQRGGKTSGA